MTRKTRGMRAGAALAGAGLLVLAGCSSGGQISDGQSVTLMAFADRLRGSISRDDGQSDVPHIRPGQRVSVDPSVIEGVTTPLMLAHVVDRGAVASLAPVGVNGGVVTWQSPDGVSLSFAGGVLVATRGLNGDLIGADVLGTVRAVRAAQSGTVTREHRMLDGELELLTDSYTCAITVDGPETVTIAGRERSSVRMTESCAGADSQGAAEFTNVYWRDAQSNVIWQSAQWVGRGVGVVILQRLVE